MTEQNKQWLNEHVLTQDQVRKLIENKLERALRQKEASEQRLPKPVLAD